MRKSIMEIVAEAKAMVPAIDPEELKGMLHRDDVLVVDVRDAPELAATGKVRGALNVSRGMLEFRADEGSPAHDKAFARDRTIVVYCATGGRAALAARALLDLGYENVRCLGAFKDWVAASGAVEGP